MATPNLLLWNRLEPHPRSENIEESLKAKIYDPLWMLSRQWQLGEFQAEDAGRAMHVKLSYEQFLPEAIVDPQGNRNFLSASQEPIEAVVENTNYQPDLYTRIEIGRQWFRLLENDLEHPEKETIIQQFQESALLQFQMPPNANRYQMFEQADILCNKEYINLLETLTKEKKVDGGVLCNIIAASQYSLSEYILNELVPIVDQLGQNLLNWARRIYNVNIGANPYWLDQQLEYQFDVDFSDLNKLQKLKVKEYPGTQIDWYQFDLQSIEQQANPNNNLISFPEVTHFEQPAEVKYPGMPYPRWWQMEDNTVNFGNLKANSSNIATMLFTQFGMLYSNDWFTIPLQLEKGAMYQFTEMVVTDNFGIRTLVKNAHQLKPNENWAFGLMYNPSLNNDSEHKDYLLIPPTIDEVQKSTALEEVNLLRDEMANMVWAIEKTVPDQLGAGTAGKTYADAVQQFLQSIEEPLNILDERNNAKVNYNIASSVPENWIPFIPVQIKKQNLPSRQIQLQRASMPRIVNGYEPTRIRPKTSLLSKGLQSRIRQPFYLHEEEVPRAGLALKGQWKRVRWINGQIITWYTYEKTIGRGEGHSGLKFDFLSPK